MADRRIGDLYRSGIRVGLLKGMKLLREIFGLMRSSPKKTFGEAISQATGGVNLVEGKQTWELAESEKDDFQMMRKCCDAELATYEKVGLVPAPYYFERVAILAWKAKDFREEIAWCEKYIAVIEECYRKNDLPENRGVKAGPRYKAIVKRLEKAKLLLTEKPTGTA